MKLLSRERENDFDYSITRSCKNCENEFAGRYCNRCGEKVIEPDDKSFREIFGQFVTALTFADTKLLRSLRLLFFRTGELSRNFINGIRVPFLRPVSLFFLANLLYFLFPIFETFNSHLRTQMHFLPHSSIATRMVEERIEKEKTTLAEFTIKYQQQSTNMAKLLLIIFVVLMAIPLMAINYSSGFYFYDHLIVSLEYNSISILINQILLPWIILVLNFILKGALQFLFNDTFFSSIIAVISVLLFYLMQRRVYNDEKKPAWIKAALMVPSLFICLQIYRAILFFVTMWTL